MKLSDQKQALLRTLPGVDRLLVQVQQNQAVQDVPKRVFLFAIRDTLERLRKTILSITDATELPEINESVLMDQIVSRALKLQKNNLIRAVNATGVVVHTNLGRSCLAPTAIENLVRIAGNYSNLEFDLKAGKRGSRYRAVEALLCELSGAEAAMVVNNNAAAVLLCLDTLARGKRVVLSRGEMVEIGGSFRIPDVMAKSGALLTEVGTTNRTHLKDYENAISSETGLLLKVHTSNYRIVGFTASVELPDLVALAKKFELPVMEDLGSGNLIQFETAQLASEPTVQVSVQAGADVVTFSGDKLLGGPQAGLIVGKKAIVDRIKANPLTRALRIDKLTLAALESTLRLYRDIPKALAQIPTLRMLCSQLPEIEQLARQLADALDKLKNERLRTTLCDLPSRVGGGALPTIELPSCCVGAAIQGLSANAIDKAFRANDPPIIGRIENDLYIIDPRTVLKDEAELIVRAFERLLEMTAT
ncbi:MAG: L-seryl-tRNA(Sec) selenium transferase [Desulfobacteraceae bacterium]